MHQLSYPKLLRRFSIIGYITLLLSGCLVSGDDGTGTILRSEGDVGITLHTYQDGDFIKYTFSGQQTIGLSVLPFHGTILVEWDRVNPLPEDPFNNTGVRTVLKEVTTMEDDNGDLITETFRYIAQDQNGSYVLHAYNDTGTSPNKYFWLDTNNSRTDVEVVELFHSPFDAPGQTSLSYNILRGCDGVQVCDSTAASTSSKLTFRNNSVFETPLGDFESLLYDYNFGILPVNTPNNKLPAVFDIRTFYGDSGVSSFGEYHIFPEVGIVGFFNACTNNLTGVGHNYTAQIIATNIAYPRAVK